MKKFAVLAMMLLVPAFAANAAGRHHEAALKYHKRPVGNEHLHEGAAADKSRQDEQQPPVAPPVTRLPVPPDTFRA
jgi:hypothetical protein